MSGKLLAYGFNMVISEILTWKTLHSVTLHLIFNINARLQPMQANHRYQLMRPSERKHSGCKPAYMVAAMIAAAEADTAKTSL